MKSNNDGITALYRSIAIFVARETERDGVDNILDLNSYVEELNAKVELTSEELPPVHVVQDQQLSEF